MHAPLRFHHPQVAQVLDLVRQLQAHERLPAQAWPALHAQGLRALFAHAWRYSPFWRARLDGAGFDADAEPLAVLARLPPLERRDLQIRFEEARARAPGWTDQHMTVSATSGSTGQPVRVEKLLQTYLPLYSAFAWLDNLWHRRDPNATLAILGVQMQDGSKDGWDGLSMSLGYAGKAVRRGLDDRSMASHLHWLAELRPAYLKCGPMVAAGLAALALEQGIEIRIAQIFCQSERVSPRQRALCLEAFGATIVDRYSCEESGWIALQCPEHGQLHVLNPAVLLEIVDDALQPCAPGQVGRVLLTSLHSHAMPLIRYDLGDLAEWGACACGRGWPVLGKLWGRTRSRIRLRSGAWLAMPFLGDDFGQIPAIHEFRIRQYRGGEVEMLLRAPRPLTPDERARIAQIFVLNGLSDIELRIREVAAIDWPPGGKREEFAQVDAALPPL